MGKIARTGLGIGLVAAGIATGNGWFTAQFWRQAGLYAFGRLLQSKLMKGQEGPRLDDLGVQLAQEGADLPKGWGRWRQSGTIVYCPGLNEHRDTHSAGKGGPSVTEYKYSASAMILGGRGPITRVERVRLNDRVVYDWNNGNEKGFKLVQQGNTGTGEWKWVKEGDGKVRIYPGTFNQPVDTFLQSVKGVGQWTAYPNLWGAFFEECNLDKYGGRLPNATFDCYNAVTDLGDIVTEICLMCGLYSDDIDVDELRGTSIAQSDNEGYVLASRRAASDALEELGFLFNFKARECNGVLQFVKRGRVSVATITSRQATVGTNNEPSPPIEEKLLDSNELPLVEEVIFGDANRESNTGMRRAVRSDANDPAPVGARGGRKEQVTVTAQLRGGRALRAAQIRLGERWAARETYPLSLSFRWLRLAASDEITLLTPDGPKPLIWPGYTQPFFGPLTGTGVGLNKHLYTLPMPSDGEDGLTSPFPDTPETPIPFAAQTVAVSSDRPDTISKIGVIFGATQLAERTWSGAEANVEFPVSEDPDEIEPEPTNWKKDYDITIGSRATMGYLRTAWTPSPPEAGTQAGTIPVKLYFGELHTRASNAPYNANTIVFENGLVVRFTSAAQNGSDPLSQDLSGYVSGIWGSDYAEAGIQNPTYGAVRTGLQLPANTKFLLLYDEEGDRAPGWDFTGFDASKVGQARRITFWPHDVDEPWNHSSSYVFNPLLGRNVQPISPKWDSATRDGSGNVTLQGHARTRYVEANTDNPTRLSESPSAGGFKYEVTFTSGSASGTVVKYTSDPMAVFNFSWTSAQIGTIVGRTGAEVAAAALTGSVALWSDVTGYGRRSYFSFAAPPTP